MCGIGGFSISDKDHRTLPARALADALTRGLVVRGRDATGAAWTERGANGKAAVYYAKEAIPAPLFARHIRDLMPQYPRIAIIHTRYATKGDPENPANNHPILIPDKVIGIHNGHIANDDALFRDHGWDRIAEVDSEAIFHLVGDAEQPEKVLHRLRGNAAVAWLGVNDPHALHLARVNGSPLWVAYTHGGSTVFASTADILTKALDTAKVKVKVMYEVAERTYMRLVRGRIVHRAGIGEPERPLTTANTRVVGMPLRWEANA